MPEGRLTPKKLRIIIFQSPQVSFHMLVSGIPNRTPLRKAKKTKKHAVFAKCIHDNQFHHRLHPAPLPDPSSSFPTNKRSLLETARPVFFRGLQTAKGERKRPPTWVQPPKINGWNWKWDPAPVRGDEPILATIIFRFRISFAGVYSFTKHECMIALLLLSEKVQYDHYCHCDCDYHSYFCLLIMIVNRYYRVLHKKQPSDRTVDSSVGSPVPPNFKVVSFGLSPSAFRKNNHSC